MGRVMRVAIFVASLFLGLAAGAQEVVLFKDYRSLIVQSHRVEGIWTYLRVGTGEMAVPSSSVLQVDQEQAQSAPAAPSSSAVVLPATGPPRPEPSLVRQPPGAQPMPPSDPDEEDSLGDEDDGADEPPPPPPAPPKNPLGGGIMARPQPLQQPAQIQPPGH